MATVTLQPTSAGIDTYIDSGAPSTNRGSLTILETGRGSSSGGTNYKTLVRFDLSSIPTSAVVTSATLRLNNNSGATTDAKNVSVHRSLVEWAELEATWQRRLTGISWSGGDGGGAGSDYATTPSDTVVISSPALYAWDVSSDVENFLDGSLDNYGWWVIGEFGSTGDRKQFFSSDSGGTRPSLEINFTVPAAITATLTGQASCSGLLRGRGALAANISGEATVSGRLLSNEYLVGHLTGQATVIATLRASGRLAASLTGQGAGSGVLRGRGALAANISGEATVSSTLIGGADIFASLSGSATLTATGKRAGILRASLSGQAKMIPKGVAYARHVAVPRVRNPAPLLEITDGEATLNLLDPRAIKVCRWRPAIAQYKGGGQWSDSPQAHGRRLKLRRFANVIEVLEFDTSGKDQDEASAHMRTLLRFIEAAADYWTSRRGTRPIYLRARSAYEQHTRYALIHAASVPELADVLDQTFFTAHQRPVLGDITLRLERGQWLENPPGVGTCVAVSSSRSWTVTGWASSDTGGGGGGGGDAVSGDVRALVQAANGDILIGTNDAATIYRSSDEGVTWFEVTSLGSSTDSINAITRDNAGNLFAAITGGASGQGIWRSTNHGANWTKVKSHPSNTGYHDIAIFQSGSRMVAVGEATPSNESPVIYSNNQGNTWQNLSPSYYRKHIAVATMPDPVLFTYYPGEILAQGAAFFIGVDSYYTEMWGVTLTPAAVSFGTIGGGAGDGGLDMAAFLFKNASGVYNRRALWAVKSHLHTANTEIWQWPGSPTGPFSFAKVATITGEVFNVLYVDPVEWTEIGAQRTVWAGANGKIFVSYNSGLTWSLATDAPTNQVRCFLRTAAGTMLAGCDNAEIFLFGGGSGGEGGGSGESGGGGEAGGSEIVNSQPLGRAATCDDEVYVANKSSYSNVTHVLYYDGAAYTELQFATDPPYALLGDPPASGDITYFGVSTGDANVPSGTFSSLVFDITQLAEDLTIAWEYWDGDSWEALDVQDNTSAFRVMGVNSVHWVEPSDWDTTSVDSITGYWVRARVSAVGGSPVGPVHANRYIYAANLPYVEIAASEIGGEMPALAQTIWSNQGDNPAGVPDMAVHRLLVGLRSYKDASNFDAYLNLSDAQVPFGVTLTATEGSFEDSVVAPTSRRYTASFSGGDLNVWQDLVRVTLATTIARDYYGDFRVFLRGYIASGDADDWKFRLAMGFGSGGVVSYGREQFGKPAQVDFRLFDMGSIHIPNATLATQISDELSITVQGYATATVAAKLYDLILLPLDEWAGDFVHTNLTNANIPSGVEGSNYLDIDSITNPKTPLGVYNRLDSGLVKAIYQPITNGEAILQMGQRQRLWFLAASYDFATSSWGALPSTTGRVRVNKVQQYLGLRGAG